MSKHNEEEDMHPLFRWLIRQRAAHPRRVSVEFTRVILQQQEEEEKERASQNWTPIFIIRRPPNPSPTNPPNMHAVWFLEQEGQGVI